MHEDLSLCWRVEEACQLAWPALHSQHVGGYVLRYSGSNRSRRANSFNPLNGPRAHGAHFVALAEPLFDHFGMRYCFRMPEIANELDIHLATLGYQREAETITLYMDQLTDFVADRTVYVAPERPPQSWLDFYFGLSDEDGPQRDVFCQMLGKIAFPMAYGEVRVDGHVAAIAYVVLVDDLAIIESVATDPNRRRQGLAQRCVTGLLNWAGQQGCTQAALQVVAENEAATSLYAKLGFSTELYRYHYRVKDQGTEAPRS